MTSEAHFLDRGRRTMASVDGQPPKNRTPNCCVAQALLRGRVTYRSTLGCGRISVESIKWLLPCIVIRVPAPTTGVGLEEGEPPPMNELRNAVGGRMATPRGGAKRGVRAEKSNDASPMPGDVRRLGGLR